MDVVGEGGVEVAEVGHLGRPVVHLYVDVGVDVGVPRGRIAVVPDPLQVGRQGDAPAARDEQVAAIGEVELGQEQVVGRVAAEQRDEARRVGVVGGLGQRELAPLVELLVVGDVVGEQGIVTLLGSLAYGRANALGQQVGRRDVVVVVGREVSHATQVDGHGIGTADADAFGRGFNGATFGNDHGHAKVGLGLRGARARYGAAERGDALTAGNAVGRLGTVGVVEQQLRVQLASLGSGVADGHDVVGMGCHILALVVDARHGECHACTCFVDI